MFICSFVVFVNAQRKSTTAKTATSSVPIASSAGRATIVNFPAPNTENNDSNDFPINLLVIIAASAFVLGFLIIGSLIANLKRRGNSKTERRSEVQYYDVGARDRHGIEYLSSGSNHWARKKHQNQQTFDYSNYTVEIPPPLTAIINNHLSKLPHDTQQDFNYSASRSLLFPPNFVGYYYVDQYGTPSGPYYSDPNAKFMDEDIYEIPLHLTQGPVEMYNEITHEPPHHITQGPVEVDNETADETPRHIAQGPVELGQENINETLHQIPQGPDEMDNEDIREAPHHIVQEPVEVDNDVFDETPHHITQAPVEVDHKYINQGPVEVDNENADENPRHIAQEGDQDIYHITQEVDHEDMYANLHHKPQGPAAHDQVSENTIDVAETNSSIIENFPSLRLSLDLTDLVQDFLTASQMNITANSDDKKMFNSTNEHTLAISENRESTLTDMKMDLLESQLQYSIINQYINESPRHITKLPVEMDIKVNHAQGPVEVDYEENHETPQQITQLPVEENIEDFHETPQHITQLPVEVGHEEIKDTHQQIPQGPIEVGQDDIQEIPLQIFQGPVETDKEDFHETLNQLPQGPIEVSHEDFHETLRQITQGQVEVGQDDIHDSPYHISQIPVELDYEENHETHQQIIQGPVGVGHEDSNETLYQISLEVDHKVTDDTPHHFTKGSVNHDQVSENTIDMASSFETNSSKTENIRSPELFRTSLDLSYLVQDFPSV